MSVTIDALSLRDCVLVLGNARAKDLRDIDAFYPGRTLDEVASLLTLSPGYPYSLSWVEGMTKTPFMAAGFTLGLPGEYKLWLVATPMFHDARVWRAAARMAKPILRTVRQEARVLRATCRAGDEKAKLLVEWLGFICCGTAPRLGADNSDHLCYVMLGDR